MSKKKLIAIMSAVVFTAGALWAVMGFATASGTSKSVLIRRVHHGFYQPRPDGTVFILAIGSDAGSERYKRSGPVDRGRADSIHIIAINPAKKAGTIVGIPRDMLVSGGGYTGKINGALAAGGLDLMARVVEKFAGIELAFSIVTSFEGFEDMVNEMGGVVVDVPYDVRDLRYSNANFDKGQQVLGGYQALSFARNRYSAPNGDFSRAENQGLILLGALRRARAEAFESPGILLKYLKIFFKYVETDLTPGEALELGMLAVGMQTTDIRNVVVQGTIGGTSDGASVVRATKKSLDMLADVADDGIINTVEWTGESPIAGIDPSARRAKEEEEEPLPPPSSPTPHPSPSASAPATPDPTILPTETPS